ncbi:MAG: CoA-binding protein [Symploca sp. SIO2B6]|nr:CoA-binding protein [Symploca sp. SIO2B6]
MNDDVRRNILAQANAIAVVGHSHKPSRPSYQIAHFLRSVGYRVYPVNPVIKQIDGQPCYASLAEVPEPVDIVNVFRRSEYLPAIVADMVCLRHTKGLEQHQTLWTQLGICNTEAAQSAKEAGLTVFMDICIKLEYLRLFAPM